MTKTNQSSLWSLTWELLGKIVHNYTDGRLIGETFVWVSLELVSELRELPAQELRVAQAQMKQVMSEMFLNNLERSYVYGEGTRQRTALSGGRRSGRNDHQLQRTRGCS